jgi:hypothetical protein
VHDFLSRSWSHHLSMIALREGPDSANWNSALAVADTLIDLLPREGKPTRSANSALQNLREPIESVLASSGITGEAAHETIRRWSRASRRWPRPARPRSRRSWCGPPPRRVRRWRSSPTRRSSTTPRKTSELLRSLQIGVWLDLAGEDGKLHPAKLSWVSPISSRLMFVNRRGVRILVASVEELAAMKKQGTLVLREQDQVFDQVLHRVMGRCRTTSPDARSASPHPVASSTSLRGGCVHGGDRGLRGRNRARRTPRGADARNLQEAARQPGARRASSAAPACAPASRRGLRGPRRTSTDRAAVIAGADVLVCVHHRQTAEPGDDEAGRHAVACWRRSPMPAACRRCRARAPPPSRSSACRAPRARRPWTCSARRPAWPATRPC